MNLRKAYEKYNSWFTFKGRLDRKMYRIIFLTIILLLFLNLLIIALWLNVSNTESIIVQAIVTFLGLGSNLVAFIFLIVYISFWISVIIFFTCQSIRRLHDINSSGIWIIARTPSLIAIWFLIIPADVWQLIIVILAMIFELTLLLKKGADGKNKYG